MYWILGLIASGAFTCHVVYSLLAGTGPAFMDTVVFCLLSAILYALLDIKDRVGR